MASGVSSLKSLGDRNHGGALFILPREIRDEIYRFLLKRHYTILQPECTKSDSRKDCDDQTDRPGLAILQVSRIISYEAQELLYAESTFHIIIKLDMSLPELKGPFQVLDRVKKVNIIIRCLTSQSDGSDTALPPAMYCRRIAEMCSLTFDSFMGNMVRRDSCHIQICDFGQPVFGPLDTYIVPRFAAFTGFDSIVVEVFMTEKDAQIMRKQRDHQSFLRKLIPMRFEGFERIVTHTMGSTMGPAISSNDGFTIRLQFKPREHAPSRVQAYKLLLEAIALEEGA